MQREPPATAEGWHVRHDLRRIDWDAWREASEAVRERALEEGREYLAGAERVDDADAGGSAVYAVQGHDADLMVVHLRPTMADLDALERRFETTAFAEFTERASSFVSVTEASGYSEKGRQFIEGEIDDDSGLANYMRSRLYPEIPATEFVSFYPMSKRRQPEQNWYDLPFAERKEHVERHGEIGREFGGRVTQMITGAMGFDDWEWGVTLWAEDMTDVKELLARMRFDQSTSKFADFGPFHVGRRFPPEDLEALLAGEAIPTDGDAAGGHGGAATETSTAGQRPEASDDHAHADAHADDHAGNQAGDHTADGHHGDGTDAGGPASSPESASADGEADAQPGGADDADAATGDDDHPGDGGGPPSRGSNDYTEIDDAATRLGVFGVHEGEDYDPGAYALLYHSDADAEELAEETASLRSDFEHYDRHVLTTTRASSGQAAVISVWEAREAADVAAGFLGDLPGVSERLGGPLGEGDAADVDDAAEGEATAESEPTADGDAAAVREELADLGIYAGQPHGEDVYALVLYSEADGEELADAVASAREEFADAAGHVKTAVYEATDADTTAVVSLWDAAEDAERAGERLADLPGVIGRPEDRDGFGTMGMFYTVKPEHREDFLATFESVGDVLAEMDGHRETALLVNREQETDMFIASRWDGKDAAMDFFRSDEFSDTVEWGREVLADRPRHVFLA